MGVPASPLNSPLNGVPLIIDLPIHRFSVFAPSFIFSLYSFYSFLPLLSFPFSSDFGTHLVTLWAGPQNLQNTPLLNSLHGLKGLRKGL